MHIQDARAAVGKQSRHHEGLSPPNKAPRLMKLNY